MLSPTSLFVIVGVTIILLVLAYFVTSEAAGKGR